MVSRWHRDVREWTVDDWKAELESAREMEAAGDHPEYSGSQVADIIELLLDWIHEAND
jgi:hypothetical protein